MTLVFNTKYKHKNKYSNIRGRKNYIFSALDHDEESFTLLATGEEYFCSGYYTTDQDICGADMFWSVLWKVFGLVMQGNFWFNPNMQDGIVINPCTTDPREWRQHVH